MRVLVLGGTRFIGRRIVELLLARGDEVLVVHRGSRSPPTSRRAGTCTPTGPRLAAP